MNDKTTTEAPFAWLDLDAIVPAELRDRMGRLAGLLERHAPVLAELAAESVAARDEYTAAVHAAGADEIVD
jgi:hypothetical protein